MKELKKRVLRITFLKVFAAIYLVIMFTFTLINYSELSYGEGWGLMAMLFLFILVMGLLLVDVILAMSIKSRVSLFVVEFLVAVIFVIYFLPFLWE